MLIVNSNNLSKSKYKDERRTGGLAWMESRISERSCRIQKMCSGSRPVCHRSLSHRGPAMEHIVDIDPRNVGNVQNGASRHSCAREGRAGQTIKHSEGWVVCRYLGETYDKIHPM